MTSYITSTATPMSFSLDILSPPPELTLLINPTSMNVKFTPKVSEQRVRSSVNSIGYVFQAHHDELDVISCSGISAMYMTSTEGITRLNRISTDAHFNLESLVRIYKNNGTNQNTKTGNVVNPCSIDSVGRVIMIYDNYIYKGHFTSFSTSETDDKQFNTAFSFEYKVTENLDMSPFTK